jgi:hypothetical protein
MLFIIKLADKYVIFTKGTMDLNTYFSTIWKPNTDQYTYSGWALLSKIKKDDMVLDVGCGYNPFKDKLGDRLTGIDPFNDSADLKIGIDDFQTEGLFDAIFCLGSINFGDEATILSQIRKVVSLCKQGGTIYWRQNPGRKDHGNKECEDIDFFDWSFERNIAYADLFNCRVDELKWDNGRRIYAEWKKR